MQFDATVVGAGEATSPESAGRHTEIASVFLDHDICGDLGGTEDRVLRLVDGKLFPDPVGVLGVSVVPSGFEFLEVDGVGPVAIDLVGAHVNEGRLGAG